jgi:hypothetical protein
MSIFGNIVSAIFGHRSAAGTTAAVAPSAPAAKGTPTATGAPATGTPLTREQVEGMIEKIADAQDYNWKQSIVDLMKLLKLDSSLSARKQLAQELGYKGDLTGSAEMNKWLHKQVMQKLADSGGVVPESLKQGQSPADAAREPGSRTTGIFGKIVSAIFGHGSAAGTTAAVGSAAAAAAAKPITQEQVEAMIAKLADGQREKYNWKGSIVDLMKLLKLDSSLSARKQLAQELGYKGDLTGSAEMNKWLYKHVMQKLADSGGVVPDSLKHA